MMINKRLIGTVPDSKPYIAGNVALQWLSLLSNAGMIFSCAWFLQQLLEGAAAPRTLALPLAAGLAAVLVRGICTVGAGRMSFLAARSVKRTLRRSIYEKLLRLGPAYSQNVATSEAVQLAAEGVEQLETYFGAYLPQFFYSMLAPATLFALLAPVSLRAALALLVCVPLIPAAIAAVQTFAKKLLGRYWGQYTALGDTFLENLQGLTTLKIYQADGYKQEEMNREAEKFRRITMKVLTMQLNSITIMDLVAYGGAALGVIMAVTQYMGNQVSLAGCLLIILLDNELEIWRREQPITAIPMLLLTVILIFFFWIALPLMLLGLFFGFRYQVTGPDLEDDALNGVMGSVADTAADVGRQVMDEQRSQHEKSGGRKK